MAKRDVKSVLAENVMYFTGLDGYVYKSDRALALAAGLAPNTVTNIKKRAHAAQIDNLEALAAKLPKIRGMKCEAWMLLHPDLKRVIRALDVLATYEEKDRESGQKEEIERAKSAQSTKSGVNRETQRQGT